MATIRVDVDELRDYMRDYYGTAMFSGFGPAILDLADVERMSAQELCELAEDNGIDLHRFEAEDD